MRPDYHKRVSTLRLPGSDRAVLVACGAWLLVLGIYPAPLLDYLALALGTERAFRLP